MLVRNVRFEMLLKWDKLKWDKFCIRTKWMIPLAFFEGKIFSQEKVAKNSDAITTKTPQVLVLLD